MTCVAVTRGGEGGVWRFPSLQGATDHPLIQLGDLLCCSLDDVSRSLSEEEIKRMARRLGSEKMERAAADGASRAQCSEILWQHLSKIAAQPPEDAAEIVRLIRLDRAALRAAGGGTYRLHPEERKRIMTDETNETNEKVKRAPPKTAKYSDTSVISFGRDKDGKEYGPDNNPKRSGSAANERFAKYVTGQTIKEAMDAGITRADINWDAKQGFIVLS